MLQSNALSLASLEGPDFFAKKVWIYVYSRFKFCHNSHLCMYGVVVSILDSHWADLGSNPLNSISFFTH